MTYLPVCSATGPVHIRYDGDIVHRLTNVDLVASRSPYFDALLHRWDHNVRDVDGDAISHDIPALDSVGKRGVQTVLKVLEGEDLTALMLVEGEGAPDAGNSGTLGEQIVQVSFYLGCDSFVLPILCENVGPKHRLQVARFLSKHDQSDELDALFSTPGFFDGFEKSMLPLCEEFCVSARAAVQLLIAYRDAPELTYLQSTKRVFSSALGILAGKTQDNATPPSAPLTVGQFGMLTIQKYASSDWSREDLNLILHVLPLTSDGYDKPVGLEGLISKAILHQLPIPAALRHWQDLDVAFVAPALFDARRMDEAPTFRDPTRLLQCIVDEWTPEECVAALEEDRGGIRRLLESAKDNYCGRVAQIPVFLEATRRAQGSTQHLLYRRLFLHTDFDPQLPSMLLVTALDLGDRELRAAALNRAVQYLEHGDQSVEQLDLPWGDAGVRLTERTAAALDGADESPLWNKLDISKLDGSFLDFVPPRVLARCAYEEARCAREEARNSQGRVRQLQNEVDRLERKVESLQRELSRFTHGP